ncbi:MAG TPA: reverse transcriptase-like protein [Candidatus Saccharimonadales bacterium]|nr:reverse transcriptase-like protein [Candidatus Saccharimonadales bacterium]
MNQRISVRAIIRNDDKILLLRRANGRESILHKYELPGGKLEYGEQPEDALRRHLHEEAGLHIQTAQLFDTVTYIDRDDRDIQYAVIVYSVGIASGHHAVELSQNYDKYDWINESKIQQDTLTDLSQLLLGIIQQDHLTDMSIEKITNNDDINTSKDKIIIYSDGGSRGNPGPSAAGYVIVNSNQEVIHQGGEYLGITTNNQAEYHGVRLGLEKAIELGYKHIDFRVDSMLVVNQMNGIYKIKNRELWPINERIRELIMHFDKVTFSHVRREFNQLADGMVNSTLNAHANTRE